MNCREVVIDIFAELQKGPPPRWTQPWKVPPRRRAPTIFKKRHDDPRHPEFEEFVTTIGAKVFEGASRSAYIPQLDIILLPNFGLFDSASSYYGVLAHEIGHWSGHASRLNRQLLWRRADDWGHHLVEELTSEFIGASLCVEFGLRGDPGTAAYIGVHVEALQHEYDDPRRTFFDCLAKAEEALVYLRGLALRERQQ
jgi:antirestriction protein ArdC